MREYDFNKELVDLSITYCSFAEAKAIEEEKDEQIASLTSDIEILRNMNRILMDSSAAGAKKHTDELYAEKEEQAMRWVRIAGLHQGQIKALTDRFIEKAVSQAKDINPKHEMLISENFDELLIAKEIK